MRMTVRKLFWIWDFDREEIWLNEMASKGLALVSIGFCKYIFEDSSPGEYEVRLELLKNSPTNAESQNYIQFIEETGAEYLGSIMRWVYFRKRKNCGVFNLYSDLDSRIKHLNRMLSLLAILTIINIFNGFNNIGLFHGINSPKISLYIGILCLAVGALLGYGFVRIYNKKRNLLKDKQLFE